MGNTVWLFSIEEGLKYKGDGPKMSHQRYDHACAVFLSSQHNNRPLLVVAGHGDGPGEKSSEYWDFTVPSRWQLSSQDLPVRMRAGPRMAPTGDGKGLIMTYGFGVYSFHCDSPIQCFWKTESYELQQGKIFPLMIPAPAFVIENCDLE